MEIKPLMHERGKKPYLTLVDTGLAMAIQHLLAGLYMGDLEEDWGDWPDMEYVLELANRLAREIQDRTI